MKRPTRKDAGFSLLETLLGLTLTAMIGLLMMGSLQMGTRVWERKDETARTGADQLVVAQASEWLSQALPANLRAPEVEPFVPFRGEERFVSFLYAAPGMGEAPGLYTVNLQLVENPECVGGLDLVMRATRMQLLEDGVHPQAPRVERRRLVACIETPSFVYWGGLSSDDRSTWRTSWVQQVNLPKVVRLRSLTADGSERAVLTQRLLNVLD